LRLRTTGVGMVIMTLGEVGVLVVTQGVTGAGDSFNAALAVALASGSDLRSAVRFASAAGALAVTKLGVVPALPSCQEVEQLISLSETHGGVE